MKTLLLSFAFLCSNTADAALLTIEIFDTASNLQMDISGSFDFSSGSLGGGPDGSDRDERLGGAKNFALIRSPNYSWYNVPTTDPTYLSFDIDSTDNTELEQNLVSSGDTVGILLVETNEIRFLAPTGYVSGDFLSNSVVFGATSISDEGLIEQNTIITYGSANEHSVVLNIGSVSSVPEPKSLFLLFLFTMVGASIYQVRAV